MKISELPAWLLQLDNSVDIWQGMQCTLYTGLRLDKRKSMNECLVTGFITCFVSCSMRGSVGYCWCESIDEVVNTITSMIRDGQYGFRFTDISSIEPAFIRFVVDCSSGKFVPLKQFDTTEELKKLAEDHFVKAEDGFTRCRHCGGTILRDYTYNHDHWNCELAKRGAIPHQFLIKTDDIQHSIPYMAGENKPQCFKERG